MTLLRRIESLTERVQLLSHIQSDVDEAESLQARVVDIRGIVEGLAEQVARHASYIGHRLSPPPVSASVGRALSRIESIRARFNEEPRASTLTKGKDWKLLLKNVTDIVTELEAGLDLSWKNFAEQSYSGETPNNLKSKLAPTAANKSALRRYEEGYDAFCRIEKGDFEEVKAKALELENIRAELNFDVPEAVRKFLNAVGASGADLSLLTDEVRDWLSKNNSTNQYQIVAKR